MQSPLGLRGNFCAWGVVCLGWIASIPLIAKADIELFVSPAGNDQAAGTEQEPLATIAEAQERLRTARAGENSGQSAHVWLLEGVYELTTALEFTAEDNGSSDSSTTYAAKAGHEVIVRGGRSIDLSQLPPVDDNRVPASTRGQLRVIELAGLGIDQLDQHAPSRARHRPMHPPIVQLFSGQQRLSVAAWPARGWANVEQLQADGFSWPVPRDLIVDSQAAGMMAHGFWAHDWQDSCEPITSAATSGLPRLLNFDAQHASHIGKVRPGARYRLENVLSQLDEPGEWYWDVSTNRAYLWPTEELARHGVFVSTLDTPISIYDANNLTIRGVTIEGAGACCIEVAGGQHVCLDGCLIRHAGNLGINIYHGQNHRVINCEVTSTGAGAIRVEGGERETLQPCGHLVENCRLHDYAQLHLAYRPGVNVYGVGISVQGNEIYDAPDSAIILHGNEHRIERNHIHHVCRDTDDTGAIYLGHNSTFRGNAIRQNHIHDLGGFSRLGVIGIYLDDFASGAEVSHNVLARMGRGVVIGGGRDNLVNNNLLIDCVAAIQVDSRGLSWARHYMEGEDASLTRYCEEVNHSEGLYAESYPALSTVLTDQPGLAKGNRILRNLIDGEIGIDLHDGLDETTVEIHDNFNRARSLLMDLDHGDYRPRPGTAAETIDFENVGPSKLKYVGVKE